MLTTRKGFLRTFGAFGLGTLLLPLSVHVTNSAFHPSLLTREEYDHWLEFQQELKKSNHKLSQKQLDSFSPVRLISRKKQSTGYVCEYLSKEKQKIVLTLRNKHRYFSVYSNE